MCPHQRYQHDATVVPREISDTSLDAEAFKKLTNESGMTWIEPSNPVKTQCNPTFNSMLDQVYRRPSSAISAPKVEIQFPDPNYCNQNEEDFSDHRPLVVIFTFP